MCIDSENNMVVLENKENREGGLDTRNEEIEVRTDNGKVVQDTTVDETMEEDEINKSIFSL